MKVDIDLLVNPNDAQSVINWIGAYFCATSPLIGSSMSAAYMRVTVKGADVDLGDFVKRLAQQDWEFNRIQFWRTDAVHTPGEALRALIHAIKDKQ